jgi:myo-inositol-1(or 4)-monophosphatase
MTDAHPPAVGDRESLRALAVTTARDAGDLLLDLAAQRRAGRDLGVGTKSSASDPVSEADRAAERLIADRLAAARPDDGLLGEEGQATRDGSSGLRWVVDPLDGTVNYLYGIPAWVVSIAVEDAQGPVVGVVHHPPSGETFTAVRDHGAWLGTQRLAVTTVPDLAASLVATGFGYDPAVRAAQGIEVADLLTRVRDVRRGGAAALDLAWCAAGRLDGYLEFGLNPWDWAAGRLLVTEAGGSVTEHADRLGGTEATTIVAGGAATSAGLRDWLVPRLRART